MLNSNTIKGILTHLYDVTNVNIVSVDVSYIDANGFTIPFMLLLGDLPTGTTTMVLGSYRGNQTVQKVTICSNTGNWVESASCDGSKLTIKLRQTSYCRFLY